MEEYKFKLGRPDCKDLLRYGEIIYDKEYVGDGECVKMRKIRYRDSL